MVSIRLSDFDKMNIEIIREKLGELKNDSEVIRYCLLITANAYKNIDANFKIRRS